MLWGFVIVIKRNGTDGSTFPMVNEVKQKVVPKVVEGEKWFAQECLLGRGEGCDIRIQLPVVSKEHARIKVQAIDQKVILKVLQCCKFSAWKAHQPKQMCAQVYLTALSKTNATKLNDNVLENEVNEKQSCMTPPAAIDILSDHTSRCHIFCTTMTCSQLRIVVSAGSSPKVFIKVIHVMLNLCLEYFQ